MVGAIFASTGFWTLVTHIYDNRNKNKSAEARMLRGLGHDRICRLGEEYLKRGSLTRDEYENMHEYLYVPYRDLGGNGTAEKIMNDVKQLPIKEA